MDYHYKIKIYKEEGEKYGEFAIAIYKDGSSKERIENIKAYTYNYENGKIDKTRLEKSNVYEEETYGNWHQVKFAMPKVKAGSIIEVEYTKISPYIYTIPKWYFQNSIPTDYSRFELSVPDNFGLTPIATGTLALNVDQSVRNTSLGKITKLTYDISNVPAFKEDDYVLHENDYRSGLKYEILHYRFNNGTLKSFSKDWKSIGNILLDSEHFGKEITKKLKDLNPIVDKAKSLEPIERMRFIHNYVSQNYNWNGYIDKYKETGLKDLVISRSGNVADLNLLLINLLSKSGLEVYPIATKTRFSGLLNQLYPSLSELNYVFAMVVINGESIFLDASSKYIPSGMLPTRAINISGLKIEKNASDIIPIYNPNDYQSVTIYKIDLDEENNALNFDCTSSMSKFAAAKFRMEHFDTENDEDNQDVESSKSDSEEESEEDEEDILLEDEVTIDTIENLEDIYTSVKLKFSQKKYSTHRTLGNDLYIDAVFDEGLAENPFTEETRDFPIFYNQRNNIRRIFTFEIPEGYTIKSIPEVLNVYTADKKGNFIYDAKIVGNKINVTFSFKILSDIILPTDYEALFSFYKLIIDKQNEKIVLTKNE